MNAPPAAACCYSPELGWWGCACLDVCDCDCPGCCCVCLPVHQRIARLDAALAR